jgi:hypothetical protein
MCDCNLCRLLPDPAARFATLLARHPSLAGQCTAEECERLSRSLNKRVSQALHRRIEAKLGTKAAQSDAAREPSAVENTRGTSPRIEHIHDQASLKAITRQ